MHIQPSSEKGKHESQSSGIQSHGLLIVTTLKTERWTEISSFYITTGISKMYFYIPKRNRCLSQLLHFFFILKSLALHHAVKAGGCRLSECKMVPALALPDSAKPSAVGSLSGEQHFDMRFPSMSKHERILIKRTAAAHMMQGSTVTYSTECANTSV